MAKNKRIDLLASLTNGFKKIVDIGCDHGLVLKEAFLAHGIQEAIAVDINMKPLKQAEKNLKGYPVTFIQSDGFKEIKQSFDCAIIAGMGAHLISDILNNAPKHDITYVLQPNDKVDILRTYLNESEFKIIDEFVIYEKFFYTIIVCKRGVMKLDQEDLVLGPKLKHKKEAKAYYKYQLKNIHQIIDRVDPIRYEELKKLARIYQNGIEC